MSSKINQQVNYKSDVTSEKLLEILIKTINEDDFKSLRSLLKHHALDKFIFRTKTLDLSDSLPRELTINGGVECMINFLSTVSDSIPDKLLYMVDVKVEEKSNGYVIIGDVRVSGNFIFQLLLKDKNVILNSIQNDINESSSSSNDKVQLNKLISFKETIIDSNIKKFKSEDIQSNISNANSQHVENLLKRKKLSNDCINLSKILQHSEILTLNCDGK